MPEFKNLYTTLLDHINTIKIGALEEVKIINIKTKSP